MALGAAWTRTQLATNMVLFTGRTASADNDAMILGLNGDGGADTGFTLPANWPFTGGAAPSDAELHARVIVTVNSMTDNGVGAGAPSGFSIEESSAPWRKTIRQNGTPTAPSTLRVLVWYPHTMVW